MQKGLLDSSSRIHVQKGSEKKLIENVNKNIKTAHKYNIPVKYIINEWTNPFQNVFTGNVCKKGSESATIDERIIIESNYVYYKSVPNSFSNQPLVEYIHKNAIDTIYLTGIMAEACVYSTATNGIKKGFNIVLIEPAIGSRKINTKNKYIEKAKKKNIQVIKEIIK